MNFDDESLGTYMSKESSFGEALASSTFSAPEPLHVISEFGDGDCGEPLEAHHLRLDFTPTDDDDDYSQKKCCEFWKYIESRSDLRGMMVLPEPAPSQSTDSISVHKPAMKERVSKPNTAVSMLQFVEDKGLIDRAFEVKMQQSRCTLGSDDYELSPKARQIKCPCPHPCLKCPNAPTSAARALCEELGAWDVRHPKSMEPPRHPPSI
ncbi:uncharacterized protein LOC134667673 isoform X2 [Cydia fagiglandana]|uniref:uncharacterized protein LOC134667673 isoform X2 n=1 Tax=Cydia fagiglandana TaxID=1458189 RepID=UPI002FEDF4CD